MIFRFFLIFIFSVISINSVKSQKVALVLSGGGAKGMAHIGVLKALEEHDIPIDYIAGTSIGAMVGGLYASGYSVNQIYELFSSPEFARWSEGHIDEQYKFYYKRENDTPSWVSLKFSGDSTNQTYLPTNIIPNHQMDLAFIQKLSPAAAACDYNFDKLYIPFRCVATDIFNNEAVIFRKGDLAQAIRASMTFPLYFKPLMVDGKLLFDGGIANNFPVDIVQNDFKPDVIIGVRVAEKDKPSSADDLLSQLENLVLQRTDYTVPDSNGVLIEPLINNVGLMDFQMIDTLMRNGYNATIQKIPAIDSLVTRRITNRQRDAGRIRFVLKKPPLDIDSITLLGLNKRQKKYVDKLLMKRKDKISFGQFKSEYFKLIADGNVENIVPSSHYNKNTDAYHITLDLKPAKKLETQVGGAISSHSFNEGYLGVSYRYFSNRAYKIYANLYYGKLYTSGLVGFRIDFASKLPYIFESYLIYNNWDYMGSNPDIFFNDLRPSYVIRNESFSYSKLTLPATTNAKIYADFNLGTAWDKYSQSDLFNSTDTLDQTWHYYASYSVGFQKNTLNHPLYSTTGESLLVNLKAFTDYEDHFPGSTAATDDNFGQNHFGFALRFYYLNNKWKLTANTRIAWQAELQLSQTDYMNNYMATLLRAPAFTPTPHSRTLFLKNYRAFNYASLGMKFIQEISDNVHFRAEAFVFQPYKNFHEQIDAETGQRIAEISADFEDPYFVFSTAFVYHTVIGPLSLDMNFYEKEVNQYYWSLNFGYLIFNKSIY